ncbi:transposase domain-containing protein, partial [Streptomyces sp. TRM76130]|nr:transposase domain-containing protein [Streptomyces sp. TRM76130]
MVDEVLAETGRTQQRIRDLPRTEFVRHRCNDGGARYPSLRLLVLVSCGTRTVLDAEFGPTANGG